MPHRFKEQHRSHFKTLSVLGLPKASRSAARLIVSLIVLAVFALLFLPWIQTSHGTGNITALSPDDRAQHINALVPGRIKHWHVHDGSMIKKGDPIVEIIDNDSQLIERLQAERNALKQGYDVAKIAAETAAIDYRRQEDLLKGGLSARREFEEAKIKYKSYLALESKALAELNQAEVKLSRQSTQTLYAPRDGIIVRIIAGDIATTVKEGQHVATFVPSDVEPVAEIFVSGLDAPLVQPGRKVRLQFEGWPSVQFSGWPAVAVGTFGGVVKVVDPSVSANGRFRVLVAPDPEDQPWPDSRFLRFGAQVKGWVLLDTVRLGYEMWRQLNNFPPQYVDVPTTQEPASQ
jgi:multidrug efflux pump subunit AcrA (membrane-fusion protein)